MTKIKAVLFDLRDTLLNVTDAYASSKEYLDNFLLENGISITPDQTQFDLKQVISETIKNVGTPTDVHNWDAIFIKELFNKYGLMLTSEDFLEFLDSYADAFAKGAVLYPDAKLTLQKLRENNIKTGVIIDGTKKREQNILTQTGLGELLDSVTISEEVGLNKFTDIPLKDALTKVNVPPENIIAVGDRYDKDILHANRAGCITVKLERDKGRYSSVQPENEEQTPNYTIHSLVEVLPLVGI